MAHSSPSLRTPTTPTASNHTSYRCLPERPEVFCTTVLDCHLSQGLERYITVKESTHIISAGTTGLTTWQAAYHFVEWAVNNTDHFNRKHVLELGSGVGLVGLAVCSSCTPSSYCFTDCHPQVLSLLSHNIRLNFPDGECGTELSVKEMDWNSSAEDIISTYTNSQPLDCIIATDVVYDTEVINAFVHVLATLLKHWPGAVAYVTSTVRNEETYQNFISQLDASHILKRIIQTDSSSSGIFYYDRTQHFQMLKLDMNPQS
jgi:predicted nicotinamide N-methyase